MTFLKAFDAITQLSLSRFSCSVTFKIGLRLETSPMADKLQNTCGKFWINHSLLRQNAGFFNSVQYIRHCF